jgi:hypothetical protein
MSQACRRKSMRAIVLMLSVDERVPVIGGPVLCAFCGKRVKPGMVIAPASSARRKRS